MQRGGCPLWLDSEGLGWLLRVRVHVYLHLLLHLLLRRVHLVRMQETRDIHGNGKCGGRQGRGERRRRDKGGGAERKSCDPACLRANNTNVNNNTSP